MLCFYFHCNVTITTRASPPSASESYLFTGELLCAIEACMFIIRVGNFLEHTIEFKLLQPETEPNVCYPRGILLRSPDASGETSKSEHLQNRRPQFWLTGNCVPSPKLSSERLCEGAY